MVVMPHNWQETNKTAQADPLHLAWIELAVTPPWKSGHRSSSQGPSPNQVRIPSSLPFLSPPISNLPWPPLPLSPIDPGAGGAPDPLFPCTAWGAGLRPGQQEQCLVPSDIPCQPRSRYKEGEPTRCCPWLCLVQAQPPAGFTSVGDTGGFLFRLPSQESGPWAPGGTVVLTRSTGGSEDGARVRVSDFTIMEHCSMIQACWEEMASTRKCFLPE